MYHDHLPVACRRVYFSTGTEYVAKYDATQPGTDGRDLGNTDISCHDRTGHRSAHER
ncbi:MAG: hypothetical protein STSR0009_25040 [Methanoregula sp.]